MENRSNLTNLLSHFAIPGTIINVERFGSGLINDTYLCEYQDKSVVRKYILQRINSHVFTKPDLVMQNVKVVTDHIVRKLRALGEQDPFSVTPALLDAKSCRPFHSDDNGAYWRVYHFIETGMVKDVVPDVAYAREVGRGLGHFQSLVADLSPERLHDTLPGFHVTPRYLAEFEYAVHKDSGSEASRLAAEMAFVRKRRSLATTLTEAIDRGIIPLRVVHNDPKANNVMIRKTTQKALCMLDLDTVKPGIVHFDFGDCVRSSANPAGEDAENLGAVRLDLDLFEALAGGYLEEARFLTEREIALLAISIRVITFELGIRFLADHLRGDTYFKVRYRGHNLQRARVQFRLLEDIEKNEKKMESIVRKLVRL